MRRTGSVEAVGSQNQKFEVVDSDSNDADTSTAGHNPWSLRCHKEQLAKMKKNSKDKTSHSILYTFIPFDGFYRNLPLHNEYL